jgi:uncharacterized protein VirK/YbjX
MLNALTAVYREERAEAQATFYSPILRCLAAARILLFPNIIARFSSLNLTEKLYHPTRNNDPLYFIVRHYYISRQFTLRQRVDVAMNHHEYELQAYTADYARQVYRSDGILLWERSVDNHHFNIVLTAIPGNRHEGDLTVILSVNNISLCGMSFCYLNANIFGQPSGMTMLISKNQTALNSFRELFDQCFKQNTPQLFCLSAACGIAVANGFNTMLGIKHDAQIAYKEPLESGFRNSYTTFWEKFDAVEIDGNVYMLKVPLKLRPVDLVNPVHRRRARARRRYWDEIVHSTQASMVKYRTLSGSDPTFAAASRTRVAFNGDQFSSDKDVTGLGVGLALRKLRRFREHGL